MNSEHQSSWFFLFCIALLFGLLYYFTLQPVIGWGDSAKLALLAQGPELKAHQGYHNLRNLIGYVFGFLPMTHWLTQNITSSVFGVLSLCVFFSTLRRLEFSALASLISTFILGFSHLFWHLSVITESYAVTWFFFLLHMYCIIRWIMEDFEQPFWLYGSLFVIGLGLSNSLLLLALLPATGYLLYVHQEKIHWGKHTLLSLCSFLLGASFFLFLLGQSILENGMGTALITQFQMGQATHLFFRSPLSAILGLIMYPLYLFYQFPVVGFSLGVFGAYLQWDMDRTLFWYICIPFLIIVVFSSFYMQQRSFYIMTLSFLSFSFWIGEGTDWLVEQIKLKEKVNTYMLCVIFSVIGTPLVLYWVALPLTNMMGISLYPGRDVPFRHDSSYYLRPWKVNQNGTRELYDHLQRTLDRHSMVITDYTINAPIDYYKQVLKPSPPHFRTHGPLAEPFVDQPVETINKWLRASPDNNQPLRVYMLGSLSVFRREQIARAFNIQPIKIPSQYLSPKDTKNIEKHYPLIQITTQD